MRRNRQKFENYPYQRPQNNPNFSNFEQKNKNFQPTQHEYQYNEENYQENSRYRPKYENTSQFYHNELLEREYQDRMEQKRIQEEANTFISKEVRKIFGLELIFLPLKAIFWLALILTVLIVSVLWAQEKIPAWPYEKKYLPLLIVPGIFGAILFFLFIKTLLDYKAIKKSVIYFRSQLQNNANRLEMPPMIPWLVKKVNQKEVNAIWLSGFTLFATIMMGLTYWVLLKYYPEKNIQNSAEYITAMAVNGALFIVMLIYDLMLRRRLGNIEAIFGHIYHKSIDIGKIRFRRHLLWAFLTVVIFLILRRIGKRKNWI
ncbi:MSC_0882 family membrane protein [Mesomycoplasma hyopneumoniae]|uniref:MSC_0882 family membrane protein n=1 Tax=Mesomycoplasma hyopneumoniae TaxID=2099 RepID=UPI0038579EBA